MPTRDWAHLQGSDRGRQLTPPLPAQAGPAPEGTFAAPDLPCEPAHPDAAGAAGRRALVDAFRRHLPNRHWGDAAYDAFSHRHGRRHGHPDEYAARRVEFQSSKAFVEGWGRGGGGGEGATAPSFRVALNHLADWSRAEYAALAAPPR